MQNLLPALRKRFWDDEFARILLLLAVVAGLFSFAALDVRPPIDTGVAAAAQVDFFYLSTCPHCRQQIATNDRLAGQFPEVKWKYHEMSARAVQDLAANMMSERNVSPVMATPITVIGRKVFVGFYPDTQPAEMEGAIRELLGGKNEKGQTSSAALSAQTGLVKVPIFGQMNISGMAPLAMAVQMGALDGLNPCAIWGVVALLCIFMLWADWRRLVLLVGAFILFGGVMHLVFLAGWMSPFYVIGIMREVMTGMGVFALFIGLYQLKEIYQNRQQKAQTAKLSWLALAKQPLMLALFVGLALMAVLFNSLGFICSAAVPAAFNQELAAQGITGGARLGYQALFSAKYMAFDLVLLAAAALLLTGRRGEKAKWAAQAICALLLTAFGAMLLFAPALLVGG